MLGKFEAIAYEYSISGQGQMKQGYGPILSLLPYRIENCSGVH